MLWVKCFNSAGFKNELDVKHAPFKRFFNKRLPEGIPAAVSWFGWIAYSR
jgi:hypothetical protein